MLGNELDRLFDGLEKRSFSFGDTGGKLLGAYLLANLVTGGAGFAGGYNYGKKHQRKRLLDEARKQRRRRRFAKQPPVVLARPEPIVDSEPEADSTVQAAPSLYGS